MTIKKLNERIIDLRESKDLTQTELAKRLSIDKSAMNKIESGTRKVSADELSKLASIFDVTTDYLLGKTIRPNGLIIMIRTI
jgi:transcriptional regulator with XRE-family HTH domain